MSAATTREEQFQHILIDRTTGEETTEELREICVAAGLFDDDPGLSRAREKYMDRVIRSLARLRGWVDKDGNELELVNIPRKDEKTGKMVHYYIQLTLLNFDDQIWLVKDRLAKASYFTGEARRYYDDGCIKHGRKFQKLFNFD